MSNSVRPHRRQPTRLPRRWDSPSKNTGVGCHFLLQCMKVKSESEVAQSCPTPSDPMDCSLPGPSIHGISQARVLEWGAIVHVEIFAAVITDMYGKHECYYVNVLTMYEKLKHCSCALLSFLDFLRYSNFFAISINSRST